MTDEGRRCLKVSNIPVEWNKPEHLCHSSNCKHKPKCRYPSSVSLAGSEEPSSLPASPRGKPRGGRPVVCHSSGCLRKSGVSGGCYPPLQGICVHPGACGNPGLRAAIRPYSPRVQNGFCAVTNRAVRALTYGYIAPRHYPGITDALFFKPIGEGCRGCLA